jgi:hypothetical protein
MISANITVKFKISGIGDPLELDELLTSASITFPEAIRKMIETDGLENVVDSIDECEVISVERID